MLNRQILNARCNNLATHAPSNYIFLNFAYLIVACEGECGYGCCAVGWDYDYIWMEYGFWHVGEDNEMGFGGVVLCVVL